MRPLLAGTVSSPVSAPHQTTVEGYTGAATLPPLVADPLTSTPSKHSSPLPEFAFETPGRNVAPMVLATSGLCLPRPPYGLGLAYGPSHYTGGLNQGSVHSGFGLRPSMQALGGAYRGLGVPTSENFRTSFGGSAVSLQFSTGNPSNIPLQQRHYLPWTFGPHPDPVADQDQCRQTRVSEFSFIPADEAEKQKPEVAHVTFYLWLGHLMTICIYTVMETEYLLLFWYNCGSTDTLSWWKVLNSSQTCFVFPKDHQSHPQPCIVRFKHYL